MNKIQTTLLLLSLLGTQLNASGSEITITASDQQSDAYGLWLKNNHDIKKISDKDLKKNLSPIQYKVTQHEGTERPFSNEYWDNEQEGIYVDIVSGEPLFSSLDKYKSGTGWPSFTRAISTQSMTTKSDFSLFSKRAELRSTIADSHLGHLFDDGPKPTKQRYCINSASLRFVSKDKLVEEGYQEFVKLF